MEKLYNYWEMGPRTGKFKWRVERRGVLASGDSLDVVGKEIAGG